MAVLTAAELDVIRWESIESMRRGSVPVNFTTAQANAAIQEVETFVTNNWTSISNAIDGVVGAGVLTDAQKQRFFAYWADVRSQLMGF
ncbi:MAG: hypothetical protein KGL39_05435 [Patescibacteria group bacterium]|nr:hypothetical protein [Patescibacteria group bacterium]